MHPLVTLKNISVNEALALERKMLRPVRERADYIIDTSALTPSQLRDKLIAIQNSSRTGSLVITCMSFGYKYGIATEADLVFDVRCFPNPFYVPELKNLTGLDEAVRNYVFSSKQTLEFMNRLYDMIDFLVPLYAEEGKTQLTIAIGCTGGKHRSVTLANKLYERMKAEGHYSCITGHKSPILRHIRPPRYYQEIHRRQVKHPRVRSACGRDYLDRFLFSGHEKRNICLEEQNEVLPRSGALRNDVRRGFFRL